MKIMRGWIGLLGVGGLLLAQAEEFLLTICPDSGGINVTAVCPAGVDVVELYSCSNLIANQWVVVAENLIVSANTAGCILPPADVRYIRGGNAGLDQDGDFLCDARELIVTLTEVDNPDSDGDSLSDGEEVLTYGTDPFLCDSDADGLNDFEEGSYKTKPMVADSDDDGLRDGEEVDNRTDPLNPDTITPVITFIL